VVGRQKTVGQKHSVKVLDGDWNALKQKLRLSVLPAHERNSLTQIMQKRSGRLIDRTQGLDRDRLEIIVNPQSYRRAVVLTDPPVARRGLSWEKYQIRTMKQDWRMVICRVTEGIEVRNPVCHWAQHVWPMHAVESITESFTKTWSDDSVSK